MLFATKKRVQRKLEWINKEYSIRKYKKGTGLDREYDFYNFFKDRSNAFFKVFGKEPKRNEDPRVTEAREGLILGLYENRLDKTIIDADLERRHREFFNSDKSDDSLEQLDRALETLKKKGY